MPRFFCLLPIILGLICAAPVAAKDLEEEEEGPRCALLKVLVQEQSETVREELDVKLLISDEGETYMAIFNWERAIQRDEEKAMDAPWLLARKTRGGLYCVMAEGDVIAPVTAPKGLGYSRQYGMPGKRRQRCSDPEQESGTGQVRASAARDSGNRIGWLMPLKDDNEEYPYTLYLGKKKWVLLKANIDGSTCYYDMGKEIGGDVVNVKKLFP